MIRRHKKASAAVESAQSPRAETPAAEGAPARDASAGSARVGASNFPSDVCACGGHIGWLDKGDHFEGYCYGTPVTIRWPVGSKRLRCNPYGPKEREPPVVNIKFALNILGYHIGALDIRIELDHTPQIPKPVVDRGVKKMTRWWTGHMAS